jgi:nitrous oxidase accessory protein
MKRLFVGTVLAFALAAHDRASADSLDGATVVASFDALAAVVADPHGPSELWLRGTYRGDLIVKRSISIHAANATLEGTGTSTVLTIEASDVAIEGLAVRHSGRRRTTEDAAIKATGDRIRLSDIRVDDSLFGISLQACHDCILERARVSGFTDEADLRGDGIKLWEAHGSIVRGCTVERVRDVVVWYTRRATVEDNIVRKSRYGTHFMYAHDATVRRNRVEENTVGIFVMYSKHLTVESNVLAGARGAAGMGIGFKDSDDIRIAKNWIVANTTGTYLDDSPRTPDQPVVFESNVLALNDVAMRLHGADKGVRVRGNDFRENAVTIEIDGGGDALACDVRGNHYSDYEGYDLNGDGIGDVPYRVNALSTELTDSRPALKLFQGTVAMNAIDAIAHAVPVLDSKMLLVDPAPLVRAPEVAKP